MAAGMAPWRMSSLLLELTPRYTKSPRPCWPIMAASTVQLTVYTVDSRSPPMMVGMARGSSTWRRRWSWFMPQPRAASLYCSSTPFRPVTVFFSTGNMA